TEPQLESVGGMHEVHTVVALDYVGPCRLEEDLVNDSLATEDLPADNMEQQFTRLTATGHRPGAEYHSHRSPNLLLRNAAVQIPALRTPKREVGHPVDEMPCEAGGPPLTLFISGTNGRERRVNVEVVHSQG